MSSSVTIQIDWADLDLFGHVNNVMFFRYMQSARLRYCEQLGLTSLNEAGRLSFMVASSKCDFRKALYYPGTIHVKTTVAWAKTTSFCLHHEIYDKDQSMCADGEDVLVLYDYAQKEKCVIDAELKRRMGITV